MITYFIVVIVDLKGEKMRKLKIFALMVGIGIGCVVMTTMRGYISLTVYNILETEGVMIKNASR